MNGLWLLFATLTVIGGTTYTVATKLGAPGTNPFWFTFIMTVVILVILGACCLIAQYGFKVEVTQGMSPHAVKYAVLCGIAAALIDVGYFLALRYGGVIPTQVFWVIGDLVLVAIFAVLILGEVITWQKALGIALGIASVLLITMKDKT
ncbi:MAG: EamA family transporter [Bdellovibrionales bacterium]